MTLLLHPRQRRLGSRRAIRAAVADTSAKRAFCDIGSMLGGRQARAKAETYHHVKAPMSTIPGCVARHRREGGGGGGGGRNSRCREALKEAADTEGQVRTDDGQAAKLSSLSRGGSRRAAGRIGGENGGTTSRGSWAATIAAAAASYRAVARAHSMPGTHPVGVTSGTAMAPSIRISVHVASDGRNAAAVAFSASRGIVPIGDSRRGYPWVMIGSLTTVGSATTTTRHSQRARRPSFEHGCKERVPRCARAP